jgi:NhaP-type Na+/H+ or K+/H+ antiporter
VRAATRAAHLARRAGRVGVPAPRAPVAGLAGLAGSGQRLTERAAISFFGIRGIGSFYYLAYAYNTAEFQADAEFLFAIVGFVVLASIVLHGITSTPAMRHLTRKE